MEGYNTGNGNPEDGRETLRGKEGERVQEAGDGGGAGGPRAGGAGDKRLRE